MSLLEEMQDSKSESFDVISFNSEISEFARANLGVTEVEDWIISAASDPTGGDLRDKLNLLAKSSLSRLSLF